MKGTRPLAVPAKAPEIRNEQVQGLGVMFRGMDAAGQETLLALRGGNAWGHHHNDDGSIQFYAGGRAMIVDAAFGTVQADASPEIRGRRAQPLDAQARRPRSTTSGVLTGAGSPHARSTARLRLRHVTARWCWCARRRPRPSRRECRAGISARCCRSRRTFT